MNKTILITGSNGLLGQKLVYRLKREQGIYIIATSKGDNRLLSHSGYLYQSLDITDKSEVEKALLKFKPDAVINTASMTNVDACETEKEACMKLNVEAVSNLSESLKHLTSNTQLIHLSTDFIFDGINGPYKESDTPDPPDSVYAKSKFESEKVVESSGLKWTIIRTILVYGVVDNMSRNNIVLWAKNSLEKGNKIKVVDDQYRTPTLAEDLAEGCVLAALKGTLGIYHVSGKDLMSILEMITVIADFWHLDKNLITPVKTNMLGQPAQRPLRTGFIIDKARRDLGYKPHSFIEGLSLVDNQLKQNKL